MDKFFFFFLLILIPILIIGIPTLISFWIYRILRKKGIKQKWRVFAFLPIFVVGIFIYKAFYPSAEYYKTDFIEVTGIELPKNSEFEYKTAGYPDQHGDYTSVSIIEVGTKFYEELPPNLNKSGMTENGKTISGTEMNNAKQNMKGLKIEREFSKESIGKFYYVAFLSDKKTILVQRTSY